MNQASSLPQTPYGFNLFRSKVWSMAANALLMSIMIVPTHHLYPMKSSNHQQFSAGHLVWSDLVGSRLEPRLTICVPRGSRTTDDVQGIQNFWLELRSQN